MIFKDLGGKTRLMFPSNNNGLNSRSHRCVDKAHILYFTNVLTKPCCSHYMLYSSEYPAWIVKVFENLICVTLGIIKYEIKSAEMTLLRVDIKRQKYLNPNLVSTQISCGPWNLFLIKCYSVLRDTLWGHLYYTIIFLLF